MRTEVLYNATIILFISNIQCTSLESHSRSLSRRKRYVVFPEGSSLTIAYCITMNLIEVPTAIFTQLINFGINYDLPNNTGNLFKNFDEPKDTARRRYRRELYNKVEIILNAIGLDGKTCMYKALCEAAQFLEERGDNLLDEIIKRLFRFPLKRFYESEPDDHKKYHWAHRQGHETGDCYKLFPNCHVSLIDLLLGYKRFTLK